MESEPAAQNILDHSISGIALIVGRVGGIRGRLARIENWNESVRQIVRIVGNLLVLRRWGKDTKRNQRDLHAMQGHQSINKG
jgi:hypothetical protein